MSLHAVRGPAPADAFPVESEHRGALPGRFRDLRRATEALCAPLETEDYVVQATPDASPAKWHLAHTTWFFENFVLRAHVPGYRAFNERFGYLFNSYYQTVGSFFARPLRGHLSRPTVREVYRYRRHVDAELGAQLEGGRLAPEALASVELGLHHEAQHQELILTDLKALFAMNPERPAYAPPPAEPVPRQRDQTGRAWRRVEQGLHEIGHAGEAFSFDNETPRHPVYLGAAEVATRPVDNDAYLAFIDDGGYRRADLWLSEAWKTVNEQGWTAPLYWERIDGSWWQYTLAGMRRVDPAAPVCHVSYYEADAYARWAGCRLAGEAEWEVAVAGVPVQGNFLDSGWLQPQAGHGEAWYGDVWIWTQSPYTPYPGYEPLPGSLGEYNGKFMVNQLVLRGGSCASPRWHVRPTYRNFFYAADRWQFSGIRLGRDLR